MTDIAHKTIGRRSSVTKEVIKRLEEAFMYGFSDNQACVYASVSRTAFYRFLSKNEPIRDRFKALKRHVRLQARFNVAKAIEAGDLEVSRWYLERRDPEFSMKKRVGVVEAPPLTEEEVTAQLIKLIESVSGG